eukprot:sb/3460995/
MMRAGVVETLPYPSDWNSPIFLVKKSTPGAYRLVADLRNVNKVCIGDSYPLPNLNHVLDTIGSDQIFSSFDLSKSFWQVPYSDKSKEVTAFLYKGRQFCFSRMIMGHKASSAKFSRMMHKLLGTIPIDQVIFFIDDVFLSSGDVPQHINRLSQLLTRLRGANLKLSPEKTELLKHEVKFVGVKVTGEGVAITNDRVKALSELPIPRSVKEVQEVLGAFGYIRKWIPKYSAIVKPIVALTSGSKGRRFTWTDECNQAYNRLKQEVANAVQLAIPDPNDPFNSYHVEVDASLDGYGASLSQELERNGTRERRIVAFWSMAVPKYKRRRSQSRLEFEAMVQALRHWRAYLLNTSFVVKTDCKGLLSAQDTLFSRSDPALVRRCQELACYDFEIVHIEGKSNKLADFLSRFPFRRKTVEVSTQTQEESGPQLEKTCATAERSSEQTPGDVRRVISDQVDCSETVPQQESGQVDGLEDADMFLHQLFTDTTADKVTSREVTQGEMECICDLQQIHVRSNYPDNSTPVNRIQVSEAAEEVNLETWKQAQEACDILQVVRQWVTSGDRGEIQVNRTPRALYSFWKQFNLLRLVDGVLQRKWYDTKQEDSRWLVVIPESHYQSVVERFHNEITKHAGELITLQSCRKFYYWPSMQEEVSLVVSSCTTCAANKPPKQYSRAPMARVMYHQFNDALIIDHIVPGSGKTTVRGNNAILTLTDAWSNYLVAIPVTSQTSLQNTESILQHWAYRFGYPREIICDNHGGFRGAQFKLFFERLGCKVTYGTPYKAASTAKAEKSNRRVNQALRAVLRAENVCDWDLHLPEVCFALNSLNNRRTGFSANKMVFGREANIPETLLLTKQWGDLDQTHVNSDRINIPNTVYEKHRELQRITRRVRQNMETDIRHAKTQYDKHIMDPSFEVGDSVFQLINCPTHKFGPRWTGPFQIRKVLSPQLYVISQPGDKEKIVNISKLKVFNPRPDTTERRPAESNTALARPLRDRLGRCHDGVDLGSRGGRGTTATPRISPPASTFTPAPTGTQPASPPPPPTGPRPASPPPTPAQSGRRVPVTPPSLPVRHSPYRQSARRRLGPFPPSINRRGEDPTSLRAVWEQEDSQRRVQRAREDSRRQERRRIILQSFSSASPVTTPTPGVAPPPTPAPVTTPTPGVAPPLTPAPVTTPTPGVAPPHTPGLTTTPVTPPISLTPFRGFDEEEMTRIRDGDDAGVGAVQLASSSLNLFPTRLLTRQLDGECITRHNRSQADLLNRIRRSSSPDDLAALLTHGAALVSGEAAWLEANLVAGLERERSSGIVPTNIPLVTRTKLKGKSVFARTKRAIQLQLRGAATLARAQTQIASSNPLVQVQRLVRSLRMALRPLDFL